MPKSTCNTFNINTLYLVSNFLQTTIKFKLMQPKVLYPFTNSSYQTFLQDMANCLINAGYDKVEGLNIPWKLRLIVAKTKISCNFSTLSKHNSPLFVLGAGYIDSFAFPYAYSHNIIPILWDTWPRYWNRIISSFKRHNIQIAFFTQRSTAQYINSKLENIKCVHLPEGLNPNRYKVGKPLIERKIDILELGRIFNKFHDIITGSSIGLTHKFQAGEQLLFKNFDELTNGLADSKITICFPRNMTNPEHAGNIETLTQRYWECMFSRSLIFGHAPKELVDLLGYNPAIEADWTDINNQIKIILSNIEKYQYLVDKNFEIAKEKGTWDSRIPLIRSSIENII